MKKILIIVYKLPYKLCRYWQIKPKVLNHSIGWDTLYPFANFSEGGIPRTKFLHLKQQQKTKKIEPNDVHTAFYGNSQPNQKEFIEAMARKERHLSWTELG